MDIFEFLSNASFLVLLLIAIGLIIVSVVVAIYLYFIMVMPVNFIRKRRIPDKEKMLDPGKREITKKEVEEDEQRRISRFREFEKLRRIERSKRGEDSRTRRSIDDKSRIEQLQRSSILSNDVDNKPKDKSSKPNRNKQKVKLHSPTDI